MDEQKQTPEELENVPGGPPEPIDETAAVSEAPEPQMPAMNFTQEAPRETTTGNSPDANEADAEALMLKMMEESAGTAEGPAQQQTVERASFGQLRSEGKSESKNIEILLDVTLPVAIELGRTALKIEDILNLGPGSVVELDKLAGEPVDLLVNDKLLAKGEVVVVDENFGVRITSMISPQDRIRSLR